MFSGAVGLLALCLVLLYQRRKLIYVDVRDSMSHHHLEHFILQEDLKEACNTKPNYMYLEDFRFRGKGQ